MYFSKISKANIFALGLVINMILYKFYGGVFASVFGANSLANLLITNLIVYGVPVIVYFAFCYDKPAEILKLNNPGIKNILLICAISFLIQPVLMLISAISTFFFEAKTVDYISTFKALPLYYPILSTAFFPAVTEEIAFRGIVFSNLKEKSLLKACAFSGLLFGMAHLNGEQFFYAFFMGIIFCYFVQRTGSVISSIVSHFIINGTQTLMTLFLINSGNYDEGIQQTASTLSDIIPSVKLAAAVIVPLILFFILFEKTYRQNRYIRTYSGYQTDSSESMLKPAFFLFLAIFAFYALFT